LYGGGALDSVAVGRLCGEDGLLYHTVNLVPKGVLYFVP